MPSYDDAVCLKCPAVLACQSNCHGIVHVCPLCLKPYFWCVELADEAKVEDTAWRYITEVPRKCPRLDTRRDSKDGLRLHPRDQMCWDCRRGINNA